MVNWFVYCLSHSLTTSCRTSHKMADSACNILINTQELLNNRTSIGNTATLIAQLLFA